ncbi:ST6GAL2 [Branchiostoma lanceolatum]|uniref:beta-galactoside alpha-(2,6)-sialyltransferase n=1 Tax=Branchiostoma lanceolatum TaxID=7740 RepID=A0A8J9WGV0_BRALA|nr:ST6GAL2 [Branchiostoma lanceolatum]
MASRRQLLFGLCVCVMICYVILTHRVVFKPYVQPVPRQIRKAVLVQLGSVKNISKLRQELLCKLKRNVPFSTITRAQASRDGNRSVLSEKSLEKLVHFNSCAVVSSSHALKLHTYGQEIDSHDAVLRFNCAPTHTFEQFVGNRTDIRLINTKIPQKACRQEFWSENSTMFKHAAIVIRNMNAINLEGEKIDAKHDRFHSFTNWIKYRKTYPNRTLPFILRPEFGRDIQAELTQFCNTTRLCKKPRSSPSTGMFGVVMMLHICDWVHVYELAPSNRDDTKLRYYFDEKKMRPSNGGRGHSYSQERVYVMTLSLTPEKDIEKSGVVLLKGFSQTQCE